MSTLTASPVPPLSQGSFAKVPEVPPYLEPTSWETRARWLVLPPIVWLAVLIPAGLVFGAHWRVSAGDVISLSLVFVGGWWALHLLLVGGASLVWRQVPLKLRAFGPTILCSVPSVALALLALVL